MMKKTSTQDQQLIDVCRRAIEEKSGENIVVLTPGAASSVADFYVISSAESEPQLRAMANLVERQIREELKLRPLSAPSDSSTGWVLLDYGNVLIHLMTVEIREKYNLEALWGDHPEDPELIGKLRKRKTENK